MTAHDDDTDRLIAETLASLQRKRNAGTEGPRPTPGDFRAFARTGVDVIEVPRITEHGETNVHSLGFASDAARDAALKLLNLPALYDFLPRVYDYLRQMGCESDREQRFFAALAVSVLARLLPFADLKSQIVLPWAKSNHLGCMDSAAIALAETLAAGRCEGDILALVKHWAKIDNPALVQVALATLTWRFSRARSDTALAVIEAAATASEIWLLLLFQIGELFRRLLDADPECGISALQRWAEPDRDASLRLLSALLTLEYVQLEDAVESESLRARVVQLIGTLWDDSRLPWHGLIQEQTTDKVKGWADRTLMLQEGSALCLSYRQFFLALHERYRDQRRDRLRFHIERWDRLRERQAQRPASRRRADTETGVPRRSYRDLLTPE
jgi:hypothetical protein